MKHIWAALLAALLVVYGVLLLSRFAPAIAVPDANGYWLQGRLIATEGHTGFTPETPVQFVGWNWLLTPTGRYYSRYPLGLPGIIAGVTFVAGWKAGVAVNPALALLALWGMYRLARRLMARPWALAAVAALGLTPTFALHTLGCDSHMAVLCLLVWGLFFLLRWSAKGGLWDVFLAGIFLGAIPTVRFPEALYGLGIAVFILWHWRARPQMWRHVIAAGAGAAIPLTPLLAHNQVVFGAFWRTGYVLTNEQTGFGWEYFCKNFASYLQDLPGHGVGIWFGLGVLGILLMCAQRPMRRIGWLLALCIVPSTLLYISYYWAPESATAAKTMRFLLPLFPLYIIAGLWIVARLTAALPLRAAAAVGAALLALHAGWGGLTAWRQTEAHRYYAQSFARVTDTLEQTAQAGDVVLASEWVHQNLDYVHHWRLAETPITFLWATTPRRRGSRVRPGARQQLRSDNREESLRSMTPAQREKSYLDGLREWAGDRRIYFVGTQKELDVMAERFIAPVRFNILARVRLPRRPLGVDDFVDISARTAKDAPTRRPRRNQAQPPPPDASPEASVTPGGELPFRLWGPVNFLEQTKEAIIGECLLPETSAP